MISCLATKTLPIVRGTCVPAHRGNSTLVVGGLGVAATAIIAQHALRAYNAAQASTANPGEVLTPGFFYGRCRLIRTGDVYQCRKRICAIIFRASIL